MIKKYFLKYKWYFLSGLFFLAVGVLFLFGMDGTNYKTLTKWLVEQKKNVLKETVKYHQQKVDNTDNKIEETDIKIEDIEKEEKQALEEIDNMDSVKEMSNVWKELGF